MTDQAATVETIRDLYDRFQAVDDAVEKFIGLNRWTLKAGDDDFLIPIFAEHGVEVPDDREGRREFQWRVRLARAESVVALREVDLASVRRSIAMDYPAWLDIHTLIMEAEDQRERESVHMTASEKYGHGPDEDSWYFAWPKERGIDLHGMHRERRTIGDRLQTIINDEFGARRNIKSSTIVLCITARDAVDRGAPAHHGVEQFDIP